MSKFYKLMGLNDSHNKNLIGKARFIRGNANNDFVRELESNFEISVLEYLDEGIINHLFDSVALAKFEHQFINIFTDYSFFTAPTYKAFEGYLFQIAGDLNLPSGKPDYVGTYFDEEKVASTIDSLIEELESSTTNNEKLSIEERKHIKDMVSEMKRFLFHYRHTPAHFHGESISTIQMAVQNSLSMYRIIRETTKTLLKANLIKIKEELH